jgi:PDZ domain-containing protein
MLNRQFSLPLASVAITLGPLWLLILPAGFYVVAAFYLPIFAGFLSPVESGSLALVIVLLCLLSLLGHVAAHIWMTRLTGCQLPARIPLYPLGDAAQGWPIAATAWRETLSAGAGLLASGLLAGLAYGLWNLQLHPYLNHVSLFLLFFNAGVVLVNLVPAFPLDGGRLLRAIGWGLLHRPAGATRLAGLLGRFLVIFLLFWAVVLVAQQARFSWVNGAITALGALLLWLPLWHWPALQWDRPLPPLPATPLGRLVRGLVALLLLTPLLAVGLSLLPTNNGLEAPGIAPPVEPMVRLPEQYSYPAVGSFLLTTVVSQTPITAGEWLLGLLTPAIRLVPPERIVPPDTTPQEVALRNHQMLTDSRQTAAAVGLALAGYPARVRGLGVLVTSVLPDSPAAAVLRPGDIITAIDDRPVGSTGDLTGYLRELPYEPTPTVRLQLERENSAEDEQVSVPLMSPAEPDQPPRIGITIDEAGFDIELPFPVEIVPQKIIGGPSAGLMFTLAVYNLATPDDLTGGRVIAGTGTINPDGRVGPIGGVQQKVAGAELAGAEYFLSPPENYQDALAAARRIQVVEIATAAEAIEFLRSLPAP